MITISEHGEDVHFISDVSSNKSMEVTTAVTTIKLVRVAYELLVDLSFELLKVRVELNRLENMLLWFEDVQFIPVVSGNIGSFDWSFSTAIRLFPAAVHKSRFSPAVDWQISFNAATGMGCCDHKLVFICSRYGMREIGVSIKKPLLTNEWLKIRHLQFDPSTFFPDSKHRAISFNITGTEGVGGVGKTNLVPTAVCQEDEILPRRGSIIDAFTRISLTMEFVMYFCLFAGALLHLLPQRNITEGGGQISVLFQGLPVPAALQSLFVMNIALAFSASYGALLIGANSGTLKAFYAYFAVIFVAAAGCILACALICLSWS